jgi:hypothetical protein
MTMYGPLQIHREPREVRVTRAPSGRRRGRGLRSVRGVIAVLASLVVAVVVGVLAQPSSAQPRAAHSSAAGLAACTPGRMLLGPVHKDVGADMMVVDDTGRLTTAFSVDGPGAASTLWSRDVPASSGDPRMIRSGADDQDDAHYPAMSGQRLLGIDAAGNVTSAWREGGVHPYLGASNVMVATRSPGGAWSAPVIVNEEPGSIDNLYLAVNAAGAAVLTWQQASTGTEDPTPIMAAYRPPGSTTWLPPTHLGANSDDDVPKVGIDDAGIATLVYDSTLHRVLVRRFEPGVGWGTARKISYGTPYWAGGSELAVSPNGAATVTWSQIKVYNKSSPRQFTRRMTAAGQWLPVVERRGGKAVDSDALAIGGRGSAVTVWRNYWNDVVAQTSHRDGSWRHRVVLAKKQRNLHGSRIEVRMNRRGDTLVVWQTDRRRSSNGWWGVLWGRYRPAGGAWAPVRRLSPRLGVDLIGWTTAIGPDGTAWLAWGGEGRLGTRQLTVC